MSGKIKPLSEQEKLELRNRAKTELLRLDTVFSDARTKQMIDDFKDKFGVCEIVYKVILEDHQFNKTGKHETYLKVDMTQVPHALTYAGYTFERNLLSNLFGGCDKKNSRTVKKLRDALTHSMNSEAVEELRNRNDELHGYMDEFLDTIRTFDSAA